MSPTAATTSIARASSSTLSPGPNSLVVKVCGEDNAPELSVRLADEQGAPDQRLTTSIDIADSQKVAERLQASANKAPGKSTATSKVGAKPDKPANASEPATSAGRARPRTAVRTSTSRARSRGRAISSRTLATWLTPTAMIRRCTWRAICRSAPPTAEPTIERYLFASRLAEDRNQQNEWLNKAEALAKKSGKTPKELLTARAVHRRNSPNWRDASPIFDRVLAQDPDDVLALAGRVELYNMAGLPRTALGVLEQAVRRSPELGQPAQHVRQPAAHARARRRRDRSRRALRHAPLRRRQLPDGDDRLGDRAPQPRRGRALGRPLAGGLQQQPMGAGRGRACLPRARPAGARHRDVQALARACARDVSTLRALSELQGELNQQYDESRPT